MNKVRCMAALVVLLVGLGGQGAGAGSNGSDTPSRESRSVPMFRGDAAHTGIHPGPGPVGPPSVTWNVDLGGQVLGSPVVAAGLVAIGTTSDEDGETCVLHVRDAATGDERWRFDGGCGTPAIAGEILYVAAEQPGEIEEAVVALDLWTGVERWRFVADGGLGFGLVVAEEVVYAGGDLGEPIGPDRKSGVVYEIDAATGRERWRAVVGDEHESSVDAVDSTPAVAEGGVFFGIDHSGMYGLDATDGAERWHFRPGDGMFSSPAVVGGVVYNGGMDGDVYAVDVKTGRERWRFDAGDSVFSSPAVAGGVIFIGGCEEPDGLGGGGRSACQVFALDAGDSRERWRSGSGPGGISSPAVADGVVHVGGGAFGGAETRGGALFALDAATGRERWRLPMGAVLASAAVDGGYVYVADWEGVLYAVGGARE